MVNLFEKAKMEAGPAGQIFTPAGWLFLLPKLEGEIGPYMIFNGKKGAELELK